MSHETGQQRYRRLKADKLRAAQLAPRVIAPTRCRCGHALLMHESTFTAETQHSGACGSYGCDCTSYEGA